MKNPKNFHEMDDGEMKKTVVGEADSTEECDKPDKFEVCVGKAEKTACQFRYNCKTYYGRCLSFAPTYKIHCSDLN